MNTNITSVLIVRHADIDIPTGLVDDKTLPLNSLGEKRAQNLANIVEKANVSAIYTSTAIRTIQTAKPLVERLQSTITNEMIDEHNKIVENILLNHIGKVILIVYHAPSIPKIIEKFTGEINHIVNGFDDFYIINFYASNNREINCENVIHLKY